MQSLNCDERFGVIYSDWPQESSLLLNMALVKSLVHLCMYASWLIYIMTNPIVARALSPTTVHPVWMTRLFDNATDQRVPEIRLPAPVSQATCRRPLIEWYAKGHAIAVLIPSFAATGSDPNAAAIVETSRCHPNTGETRYATPNT